jgi:hypothetical protein
MTTIRLAGGPGSPSAFAGAVVDKDANNARKQPARAQDGTADPCRWLASTQLASRDSGPLAQRTTPLKKRSLLWAERLRQEVLEPVPHRHVVLTMPRLLRPVFRRRRELLLSLDHFPRSGSRLPPQR